MIVVNDKHVLLCKILTVIPDIFNYVIKSKGKQNYYPLHCQM